ncbi:O-antigen polymerase [Vibrio kanaloae]|uniref:O-antigen polymerase n=1 Tax=Vibrio kanaloae TaxID=170673 RepID=UPI0011B63E75|nr:O-antigen polymerase [Vibrio kanaloae]
MIETLILFVTLLVSLLLLKFANGSVSVRYLTGLNYIFYRQMIISALIGAYLISLSLEYSRWYSLDWEPSVRFYGFLWVCYSLIAILATFCILKVIFVSKKYNKNQLLHIGFSQDKYNIELIQNILFSLSLFGFLYIYFNSPSWPMLDAIMGNSADALTGRISFRNDFRGSDFIKNLISFSCSSLYFYISLSRFFIRKNGRVHLLFSFLLVLFIYTYNSQKGAILNVSIGALIIYCMAIGRLSLRLFFTSLILGVTSIILLFSVVKGIPLKYLLDTGGQLILGRLFLGNIEGFFSTFQLFPKIIDADTSLVGIPSFIQGAISGEKQEPSKLLLMKFFDSSGVENGTSGFITSYFMAEAWANYNLLGLVLSPVIVAINLFIVDYSIYRFGKNTLSLTFYATMYLNFQLHGEFVGFLYFKYFIFLLVSILPVLFVYMTFYKSNVMRKK